MTDKMSTVVGLALGALVSGFFLRYVFGLIPQQERRTLALCFGGIIGTTIVGFGVYLSPAFESYRAERRARLSDVGRDVGAVLEVRSFTKDGGFPMYVSLNNLHMPLQGNPEALSEVRTTNGSFVVTGFVSGAKNQHATFHRYDRTGGDRPQLCIGQTCWPVQGQVAMGESPETKSTSE